MPFSFAERRLVLYQRLGSLPGISALDAAQLDKPSGKALEPPKEG